MQSHVASVAEMHGQPVLVSLLPVGCAMHTMMGLYWPSAFTDITAVWCVSRNFDFSHSVHFFDSLHCLKRSALSAFCSSDSALGRLMRIYFLLTLATMLPSVLRCEIFTSSGYFCAYSLIRLHSAVPPGNVTVTTLSPLSHSIAHSEE